MNIFLVVVPIFIWLGILTFFTFRMIRHYNMLISGASKLTLREVLNSIINAQNQLTQHTKITRLQVEKLEAETAFHLQKIGLVRFNPFADTGGAQSFVLALLDSAENGIVMTSLYARTGNRWYIKHVKSGKGSELELSKEERAAIENAKYVKDMK
ncbi:hypothetical protein A2154_05215 [Candidatus Gottesmanbacteria bacterium RBG_16_43_7]|uniref:DUF4446 domain-containing protein n=1 Tax=Candidatus Gottesmanbacteria bacterium RBG_16_43_7 TaxID=1798373 RepID=A0A1F5Z925_9BACT|nr:MAG: hypothetical protein A2154_05215 [Candidatus Gottesmanbacteria bacterium RBG_16_43_7]